MSNESLTRILGLALLVSTAAASAIGCGLLSSDEGPTLRLRVVRGGAPDYAQIPLQLAHRSRVALRARDLTGGIAAGSPPPTASIEGVESSDSSVVDVVSTSSDGRFTLRGASPGEATLTVRADAGEQQMNVRVRRAEQVQFGRLRECEGPHETFLSGTEAVLSQTMLAENGDELRGWGYHPFEIRGAVGAEVAERIRVPERLYLKLTNGSGEVTVQPTVDGAGAPIDVVEPSAVKETEFENAGDRDPHDREVAREVYLEPQFVTADGSRVCHGLPEHRVEVRTPSVCDVEFRRRDSLPVGDGVVEQYDAWYLVVSEKKSGECRYSVEFGPDSIGPLERSRQVDVSGR